MEEEDDSLPTPDLRGGLDLTNRAWAHIDTQLFTMVHSLVILDVSYNRLVSAGVCTVGVGVCTVGVMLCYAMLCYAMLCCAMLCYAVLCYAMLCCAMLCCVMLCYAMLCYDML
jgi:hypothetical protein